MKLLSIIFILVFSVAALAQSDAPAVYTGRAITTAPYINAQHNFSIIPPLNAKANGELNLATESVATYLCLPADCKVGGVFSLFKIVPLPKTTVAETVASFQQQWVLDKTAKSLLDGFKPEMNATVLAKKYVAYNGRPAQRIDYNFVDNNISLNGIFVAMFVVERQALVTFNIVTKPSESDEWYKLCENAIRSLTILPDNQRQTVKPPREGIATRIDTGAINNSHPNPPKDISDRILNAKAISLSKPPYPPAALAIRAQGVVMVEVTIDDDGVVSSAKAISGHPLLQRV